ncbi:MAG: FAD-binding oxidoreductase [Firmicutes bacterium]|nr:FAD-binding oxidoreductase [Bacillota bacterium]
MTVSEAEVVIVGGGVIGCSIAYHLSRRGKRVVVLDRGDAGSGSSGACDKAAILQSKSPGLHLQLAMKSVAMFDDLARELETDIQFSRAGGMVLIEDERQLEVMKGLVERQRKAGLEVGLIPASEVRRRLPVASNRLVGATWSAVDAEVNPLCLTRALMVGAKRLGARFLSGWDVTGLLFDGPRVSGVATNKGNARGQWVVNAAGAWAPQIGRMAGVEVPIKPRRGQLLVSEKMPRLVHGDVLCARYLVAKLGKAVYDGAEGLNASRDAGPDLGIGLSLCQTRNGNLLLGGCREFAGYDSRNTYDALVAISRHAINLVPGLRQVNFIRAFAGLRPYTPDGMPILGPVDGVPGFVVAAGHEGDGIALSPVTGLLIAELLDTGKTSMPLGPFSLSRFDAVCSGRPA